MPDDRTTLTLTRKAGEAIDYEIAPGEFITVTIDSVGRGRVRVASRCPRRVPVRRSELPAPAVDPQTEAEFLYGS